MSRQVYTAYIVDGVRTPGGKRGGAFRDYHPTELGAKCLDALLSRNQSLDPKLIDDVIFGCVSQIGAQSTNIARNVVLASKLPISVAATTIDRQCGSGLESLTRGAQAVMSGTQDIIIVGGIEHMTSIPLGSNATIGLKNGLGAPLTAIHHEKYPTPDGSEPPVFSQFLGAELVAQEFKCTREECDKYAMESHQLASKAAKNGAYKNEIIPMTGLDKDGKEITVAVDEGIRPQTTLESLGKLKPLMPEGVLTAGTASQVTDGASAVLLMNENGLKKTGLIPRAKIICVASAGDDPVIMLRAPVFSTEKALNRLGMKMSQIDLIECNEAFASIPLMLMKKFNIPREKMNVVGGAIALGHPLGSTGTKITVTALNQLEQQGKKTALITLCEGGGMANTVVIERVAPGAKL
jgi:acetyl-CoA C-acetyltransferase